MKSPENRSNKREISPREKNAGRVILVALVGYLIYEAAFTPASSPTPKSPPSQAEIEYTMEKLAKDTVTASLKDPDSAEFGPVTYRKSKSGVEVVCGDVNAKNGFGGYTGSIGFIFYINKLKLVFANQGGGFSKSWNQLCTSN